MAKKNTGGLKYEDFKKSLEDLSKNLSGDQLEKANATLKKVEESLIAQKEISGVEKITLTNIEKSLGKEGKVNKTLGDIKKSLSKDGDLYKSQAKQAEKLFSLIQKQYKPLKDVKDEKPITVKEGLKSLVGGAKSVGSRIKGAFQSVKTDPLGSLKNVAGKAERKIANAFDTAYNAGEEVLATDKDFTVKRGRFAQEGVKAGKFKTEEEGIKAAKRLERREAVSEGRKNQLAESEKYGFVNEDLRKKLNRSEERKVQDDPRLKPLAKLETAPIQTTPPTTAKVEKSSTEGKPLTNFGEVGAKREMARVETKPDDQAKKEKEIEAANLAKNPEADNVRDSQEIIADNSKEDLQLSKDLLKTTQEQLTELRAIKEALSAQTRPTESKKEPDNAAQVAPTTEESGSSLNPLDFLGRGGGRGFPRGTPRIPGQIGKPSLGGRILGGIKGIGGKLGGLARGAGSVLGKLAVPLAVATAGYDAYKGVERTNENFDLKEGEESTLGQKTSSALGSVASGFSFGLVDEKEAAQGIHKAGTAVQDFFGFGDKAAVGAGGGSMLKPGPNGEMETETQRKRREANGGVTNVSTGASGFPLQSEAKPAESITGTKVKPTEAAGEKVESKGGPNWEAAKKDLESGLPPPGSPDYDVQKKIIELAKTSSPRTDKAQSIENHLEKLRLQASAAVAGIDKKPGTATFKDGKLVEPAKAESPDPQLDQDIKANRERSNQVAPLKPTTAPSTELQTLELQNKELERDTAKSNMTTTPIIMNNSSNNTKNNFMPMKTDPRPSSRGSALDKYLERTSSY